jgi:hypothetical protein
VNGWFYYSSRRKQMLSKSLMQTLAVAIVIPTVARATVIVYEPFNYGVSQIALNTVNGTALGLDGTTYAASDSSVTYEPTGLSFSNLQTSAGAARLPYLNGHRNSTRGLDAAASSGTVYGSYLYKNYGAVAGGISTLLFTPGAGDTDNTAALSVSGNDGGNEIGGVRMFGTKTQMSGTAMDGTGAATYLVLFQISDVGATSGSQTLEAWVLTEDQFNNFKAGGLTAVELNAATTGTTSTDVLEKVTYSNPGPSYFSVATTHSLRMFNYRGNAAFDEIRLGTGSLDEVTPVPEPGSLVAMGLISMALVRRRR